MNGKECEKGGPSSQGAASRTVWAGSLGIIDFSDSSIPLCCVIGRKLLNLSELSPFSLYKGENYICLLFTSDEI